MESKIGKKCFTIHTEGEAIGCGIQNKGCRVPYIIGGFILREETRAVGAVFRAVIEHGGTLGETNFSKFARCCSVGAIENQLNRIQIRAKESCFENKFSRCIGEGLGKCGDIVGVVTFNTNTATLCSCKACAGNIILDILGNNMEFFTEIVDENGNPTDENGSDTFTVNVDAKNPEFIAVAIYQEGRLVKIISGKEALNTTFTKNGEETEVRFFSWGEGGSLIPKEKMVFGN